MPPFPSPAWVDAADRCLAAAQPAPTTTGAPLAIGYQITGDVPFDYRLEVDHAAARMRLGLDGATTVLRTDGATAAALHDGRVAFTDAILDGRLVIDGDATALLAAKPALEAVRALLDAGREDPDA